jgi:hypothetical protein
MNPLHGSTGKMHARDPKVIPITGLTTESKTIGAPRSERDGSRDF